MGYCAANAFGRYVRPIVTLTPDQPPSCAIVDGSDAASDPSWADKDGTVTPLAPVTVDLITGTATDGAVMDDNIVTVQPGGLFVKAGRHPILEMQVSSAHASTLPLHVFACRAE